jgi:hypothetical protein
MIFLFVYKGRPYHSWSQNFFLIKLFMIFRMKIYRFSSTWQYIYLFITCKFEIWAIFSYFALPLWSWGTRSPGIYNVHLSSPKHIKVKKNWDGCYQEINTLILNTMTDTQWGYGLEKVYTFPLHVKLIEWGSFFGWDHKNRCPVHSRCGTIEIPPCSMALSVEHRPKFCSPSSAIVTSPYKW